MFNESQSHLAWALFCNSNSFPASGSVSCVMDVKMQSDFRNKQDWLQEIQCKTEIPGTSGCVSEVAGNLTG